MYKYPTSTSVSDDTFKAAKRKPQDSSNDRKLKAFDLWSSDSLSMLSSLGRYTCILSRNYNNVQHEWQSHDQMTSF